MPTFTLALVGVMVISGVVNPRPARAGATGARPVRPRTGTGAKAKAANRLAGLMTARFPSGYKGMVGWADGVSAQPTSGAT